MNWDAYQREVLAELGHVLYRTVSTDPLENAVPNADLLAPVALNPDSALLGRLARAAGIEVDALPDDVRDPDALARLRVDAQSKRALWPRLRVLRARLQ